jgi:hypothetical protein
MPTFAAERRFRRTGLSVSALVIVLLFAGLAVAGTPVESIRLTATPGAHVSASAVIHERGAGTQVRIAIRGLEPRGSVRAIVRAGSCARPSASFASVGAGKVANDGTAHLRAAVLFHGTQPVAWSVVTGGDHTIALVAEGRMAACGAIPPAQ